ncbi:MAG TPA: hypothetical protein VFX03_05040, partial [Thermomicrobiales bacterium]|nr:hypothetical protein [Thermomicrobiales bacterium]
ECGLTNRQVWAAVLAEAERSGGIGRADFETWLRGTSLIGRGGDGEVGSPFIVGVPHALARRRVESRFLLALRHAVALVAGVPLDLEIVLTRRWLAAANPDDDTPGRRQLGA